MYEIAPGSILQRMHVKKRIRTLQALSGQRNLRFCEVGTGKGANSYLLLKLGLVGVGYELNADSCEQNRINNHEFIDAGKYEVLNCDFLNLDINKEEGFDLIFSCMVIEHLPAESVRDYFNKCSELLNKNGCIITLVPSSMKHWGIEDDIAGHFKRYSFECFELIGQNHNLCVQHSVGLTYPLSNWILPLSNYLVNRSEKEKKDLSMQERTELSGNRNVMFKTVYPWYLKILLNELTMIPFYFLQNFFRKNTNSLVIYSELTPKS
jgi:SAM-dependent methyltransferase